MPTPGKPIRLRDIAEEAGISVQAVSMALRGNTRIAEATRLRVQKIAKRLGYQADPALAALARYRTDAQHSSTKWETVALVDDWAEVRPWWESSVVYRRLYQALQADAKRRGIGLQVERLGWQGRHAKAVFRRLYNQGIRGVLVAPLAPSEDTHSLDLPKDKFNIVTFGPESVFPDRHVVQFDFFENARLAWHQLRARGCQRVGLVYASWFGWRTGHAWLGAYLMEKRMAGFSPGDLQPLVDARATEAAFKAWVAKERPDGVVTIVREVLEWNQTLAQPLPIALLSATDPGDQGIDVNPEQAATAAFELLLMEMHQSMSSGHHLKLRVHVPGIWVDDWQ